MSWIQRNSGVSQRRASGGCPYVMLVPPRRASRSAGVRASTNASCGSAADSRDKNSSGSHSRMSTCGLAMSVLGIKVMLGERSASSLQENGDRHREYSEPAPVLLKPLKERG